MVVTLQPIAGRAPRRSRRLRLVTVAFAASFTFPIAGQAQAPVPPAAGSVRELVPHPTDLSQGNTLYLVGYAHLDTQWRWAYPLVIREFIPNTMRNNFHLFDLYPDYVFNFSGSRRYEMMKEYYPDDYAKVKKYVQSGQWFPAGSSVDEGDANVPSTESLVRHTLYGNHYFKREFGVASQEFMLPDCFGFPYALPTILRHSGVNGFSTQKLTWGSAVGIPFKVGTWEGPDGSSIVSALDPGSYAAGFSEDLSKNTSWLARIQNTGKISNAYVDYHYYGVGDRGGAPDEGSVKWMETSVKGAGPIKVVSSKSDELFKTITPAQVEKLPHYKGELLLTKHSAGSITSQAYMKRWNRKNELLANAAESSSVAAMWLGGAQYPSERLYNAWDLVLGSQMHDMLPGTSLPEAYQFCWNDELLALNQFAAVTQSSVGTVASALDTQSKGVPVVVYNPLSTAREDVVEATVPLKSAQVYGPGGKPVPTQVIGQSGNSVKILFLAKTPSFGYAVYDARPSNGVIDYKSSLIAKGQEIQNARFRVTLNEAGDIASIYDKQSQREVLKSPARLALQFENPAEYPAWNMDWEDAKAPPREFVSGPAKIRIVENGPVRVALEVERETNGSKFIQWISLAAGSAGDRIEVANKIDWQTKGRALKASFSLASGNPMATYDLQVGTIERGNNDEKKYEVPQHQWFDLTGTDGRYGAAILNDSKFGSDKPDDDTVRLTMIYTPGVRGGYQDQATQDIGRHDILYAIAPHAGDWRQGDVAWQAKRLNQPLRAFVTDSHPGTLGKTFSLLSLNTKQVEVSAVKKAEDSSEIVVRLRELTGKPAHGVALKFAGRVVSAREVNGQEEPLGPATITNGVLTADIPAFSLRAFAVKLAAPAASVAPAKSVPVALPYDLDVASTDRNRSDGAFDSAGRTLAAEQLPKTIVADGIGFQVGPTTDGAKNAVTCHGQTIALPAGYGRVYLLAASSKGDTAAQFKVGGKAFPAVIENWGGFIGQWDNRLWSGQIPELTYDWHNPWAGLEPGFVKKGEVAWFSSHRHAPAGNDIYRYSYLYKYGFPVAPGAKGITLPNNPAIRILAVTVADRTHDDARPAQPLFDTFDDRGSIDGPQVTQRGARPNDMKEAAIEHPMYWHEGGLRYTVDGSTPTASSAVYTGPIPVYTPTTIKAVELDASGRPGPITVARIDANDITPPDVVSAEALQGLPAATVRFSEPVRKTNAENFGAYQFGDGIQVTSAMLSADGESVDLGLNKALQPGATTTLKVIGVQDRSPAANAIAGQTVNVVTGGLAFSKPVFAERTPQKFDSPDLPTKGSAPWTINLFCRLDKQPENRTIIAGFGNPNDGNGGTSRYIAKFANGIHFWSAHQDVETTVPLDLGKWQMVTAVYDGHALTLYKNGERIGQGNIQLTDDIAEVHVYPKDAWDHQRVFDGDIRDFTIWKHALSPDLVKALYESGKAP